MQSDFGTQFQACEMFILELTLRAWNAAEENKRRTLQRSDVAQAITRTDIFDFLVRGFLLPLSGKYIHIYLKGTSPMP